VKIRFLTHACLLACAVFSSSVLAGPGGFGNEPYVWIHSGDYETEEPALQDEASFDWSWYPGCPTIASTYAYGDITTTETGTAKASCEISYHNAHGSDPAEDWLSQGADVETLKPFQVTSPQYAAGQTADAHLDISYEGWFQVDEQTAGETCEASAQFEVTLLNEDGDVLGYSNGSASVTGDSAGNEIVVDADDWDGLLVQGGDKYTLDFDHTFGFTAVVGDYYWLYFDLATAVWASAGDESSGDWAACPTYAEANFASTATYELRSDDANVGFQTGGPEEGPIPEPALLVPIALGGLLLRRRR
jgi:MYXO-CTERM domain-containing protein